MSAVGSHTLEKSFFLILFKGKINVEMLTEIQLKKQSSHSTFVVAFAVVKALKCIIQLVV